MSFLNDLAWGMYRTARLTDMANRYDRRAEAERKRQEREAQKAFEYRMANDAMFREIQEASHVEDGIRRASSAYIDLHSLIHSRRRGLESRTGLTMDEIDSLIVPDIRTRRCTSRNDSIIRDIAKKAKITPQEYFTWLCNEFWDAYDNGEFWIRN